MPSPYITPTWGSSTRNPLAFTVCPKISSRSTTTPLPRGLAGYLQKGKKLAARLKAYDDLVRRGINYAESRSRKRSREEEEEEEEEEENEGEENDDDGGGDGSRISADKPAGPSSSSSSEIDSLMSDMTRNFRALKRSIVHFHDEACKLRDDVDMFCRHGTRWIVDELTVLAWVQRAYDEVLFEVVQSSDSAADPSDYVMIKHIIGDGWLWKSCHDDVEKNLFATLSRTFINLTKERVRGMMLLGLDALQVLMFVHGAASPRSITYIRHSKRPIGAPDINASLESMRDRTLREPSTSIASGDFLCNKSDTVSAWVDYTFVPQLYAADPPCFRRKVNYTLMLSDRHRRTMSPEVRSPTRGRRRTPSPRPSRSRSRSLTWSL